MEELFASFIKSLGRLEEILQAEKTIANRDSAIQRFEFTIELAWKVMQKYLRAQEIICRSPKECLKEAFRIGIIPDDPIWLQMLEDRNMTVHTYDEKTAEEVYGRLPRYLKVLQTLKQNFVVKGIFKNDTV